MSKKQLSGQTDIFVEESRTGAANVIDGFVEENSVVEGTFADVDSNFMGESVVGKGFTIMDVAVESLISEE